MDWFLACLGRAIDGAQTSLAQVLQKASFWQAIRETPINDRQRRMVNHLLDGVDERLTTSKWAKIAKCPADTALRDLLDAEDHRRPIVVPVGQSYPPHRQPSFPRAEPSLARQHASTAGGTAP